jgi:hypothetical protein
MGHTPGPWRMEPRQDIYEFDIVGPEHVDDYEPEYICLTYGLGTDETNIGEANARLIAQAPALLELCQRALRYMQDPDGIDDALTAMAFESDLEDVIAKVKGGK